MWFIFALMQSHTLNLATLSTPTGPMFLVTDDALRVRVFDWDEARMGQRVHRIQPVVTLKERALPRQLAQTFDAYFAGDTRALEAIEVEPQGTAFQREVWAALRTIGAGQTLSYGALAQRMGRPKAVRAVGMANRQNPIAIVVPCHRVVGKSGALTGFAGGLDRKRWLLQHEGSIV